MKKILTLLIILLLGWQNVTYAQVGKIPLIAEIVPSNFGFTDLVDASYIFGNGGTSTIRLAAIGTSSIYQHLSAGGGLTFSAGTYTLNMAGGTCGGTNKISSISATGTIICTADQGGGGGGSATTTITDTNTTSSVIAYTFLSSSTGFTVGVQTGGAITWGLSPGYELVLNASSAQWSAFESAPSSRITAGTNLSWSANTLNNDITFPIGIASTTGIQNIITFPLPFASSTHVGILGGSAIQVSTTGNTSTIINEGVTSLVAGDGMSVDTATGTVTATLSMAGITCTGNDKVSQINASGTAVCTPDIHGSGTFTTSGVSGLSIASSSGTWTWSQSTSSRALPGFLSAADYLTFDSKITTTSLSATTPIIYNNTTGLFSLGIDAVSSTRAINTTNGIAGGGDLSADRTLYHALTFTTSGASGISIASSSATWTFSQATSTAAVSGYLSSADFATFNSKITTSSLSGTAPIFFNAVTGEISLGIDAVSSTRQVIAGSGLRGGGALSSDVTLVNEGVVSLQGTANETEVNVATGTVTLGIVDNPHFPQGLTASSASHFDSIFAGSLAVTLEVTTTLAVADVTVSDTLTLNDTIPTKLLKTNANKVVTSTNITPYLAGTSNQITVTDDGDGSATLSTPQDIHTGASNFTVAGASTTNLSITGLTAGSVPFITTSGVVTQDNAHFFWDTSGEHLILKTTSSAFIDPSGTLNVAAGGTAIDVDGNIGIFDRDGNSYFIITSNNDDAGGNDARVIFRDSSLSNNFLMGQSQDGGDFRLHSIGNGNDDFTVSSSTGHVGINTLPTGIQLEVNGSSTINNDLVVLGATSIGTTTQADTLTIAGGGVLIDFTETYKSYDSGGTARNLLFKGGDDQTVLGTSANEDIAFQDSADVNMTIVGATGFVGIGTTTPEDVLVLATGSVLLANNKAYKGYDTSGTPRNLIRVSDSDETQISVKSSGDIIFTDASDINMFIDGSIGDIGIGTTTPQARLHITETGSTNALLVEDETSDASPLVIDASGNVGIGTTTPATKLDIDTGSNVDGLRLRGTAEQTEIADIFVGANGKLALSTRAGGGSSGYVEVQPEDNNFGLLIMESDGGAAAYANIYVTDATPDRMSITVGSAEDGDALIITADNEVGIGDATPDFALEVEASSTDGYFGVSENGNGDIFTIDDNANVGIGDATPSFTLQVGDPLSVKDATVAIAKTGAASATLAFVRGVNEIVDAFISLDNQEELNIVSALANEDINFIVNDGGVQTVVMTIEGSASAVGIGDQTPNYGLDVVADVNSDDCYREAGVQVAGTCTSDIRLKKNINTLTGSLDKILNLRPIEFEWKEGIGDLNGPTGTIRYIEGRQVGLIAQEVEEVLPHLVQEKNDYLSISYNLEMQMMLIDAVQEQQEQIEAMQKEITRLKRNQGVITQILLKIKNYLL